MHTAPKDVSDCCFQGAWAKVIKYLANERWQASNLVVRIEDVTAFDASANERATLLAKSLGVLTPKHVAYTIFPHGELREGRPGTDIYRRYNRPGGFFERKRTSWGTYFRRMTHYERPDGEVVNQLEKVTKAVREWTHTHQAAYNIIIPYPGKDTARPRGGPCLNYIAPQVGQGDPRTLGLLCVYRNHDFLERAYGNYWGLCNLTQFLAREAGVSPGSLTCISSHAYVDATNSKKEALEAFADTLI